MIRTLSLAALALASSACSSVPGADLIPGVSKKPDTQPAAAEAPPKITLPASVKMTEATWYSEQVKVAGRLFTPSNASDKSPAVILAPAWGRTADTLDAYAAELASNGIVALAIDYRGWGRSGGFLYLGERYDAYDKQRFTDPTVDLVIRRGRLDPDAQVQDIRNAITFLQAQPNIDPARIGVLGLDMAGGHVITTMGMDARAKAGVAITPVISGAGEDKKSLLPDSTTQQQMIRLAREGVPRKEGEARTRNALEADVALNEYKPFWRLDAIPPANAVQFIVAGQDEKVANATNGIAAYRALRAHAVLETIDGARHALKPDQEKKAAELAAAFLKSKL